MYSLLAFFAFFALSSTSCGNLILWIGLSSVASFTVIRQLSVISYQCLPDPDSDGSMFYFSAHWKYSFLLSICMCWFLPFSKHCAGYLHHKEAGDREILMPSCLALIDLKKVVHLGTWKMEKINTIVKEKDENIDAIFWKISRPIPILYFNFRLPYPTLLIKNNFPSHHLFVLHPFLLIFGWATSSSHLLMNILK